MAGGRSAALTIGLTWLLTAACGGAPSIGDDPETGGAGLDEGRRLVEAGEFGAALEPLLAACAAPDPCREALPLLARALSGSRRPEDGFDLFSAIIVRHPSLEAEALGYRGDLLDQSLESSAAEADYLRAVELDPASRARVQLGRLWMDEGRYGEAERLYRDGLNLDPGDTDLRIRLAGALRAGGDVAAARELLEPLLADHPDQAAGWLELGKVELDEGRSQAAVVALRKAADLDEEDIESRYLLARQALRDGRSGAFESRLAEIESIEQRMGRARPQRP